MEYYFLPNFSKLMHDYKNILVQNSFLLQYFFKEEHGRMLVCNRKHDTNDDHRALFLPACLFALDFPPLNFMKKYDRKIQLHFRNIKLLLRHLCNNFST